jgi:enoyl-CoA hydratase/carnithine racemase
MWVSWVQFVNASEGGKLKIGERRDGAVVWLTLDRADRLNAFTSDGYRALCTALKRHSSDSATRVVVLSGRGRAFSVGADRSLLDPRASGADRHDAGEEFDRLIAVLAELNKPLVAAVNGLAVGFGATMLLYCDLVLLAESARLRLPFTDLAIVPEAGSTALLLERVRWPDAMWSVLSSEWIDADQALGMGLAWRVTPDADLDDHAARAAATLAALDPSAVAATKRLMIAGRADRVRQAIARELEELQTLNDRLSKGATGPE